MTSSASNFRCPGASGRRPGGTRGSPGGVPEVSGKLSVLSFELSVLSLNPEFDFLAGGATTRKKVAKPREESADFCPKL